MVGVVDVFAAAKISVQQNYRFLEAYLAVALIYWVLSSLIEHGFGRLEQHLNQRLRRGTL
jgi:L-cystine transport system permease protein